MKQIICTCLSIVLILTWMSLSVSAESFELTENSQLISEFTEYLDDGTILVIAVYEDTSSHISPRSTVNTKTGLKTVKATDSDGDVLFTFTVKGTFSVNIGVSVTCTDVTYSYTTPNSSWHFDSATTSKSGNKAMGTAIFKKKVLFITTDTQELSCTLACDVNGNLS